MSRARKFGRRPRVGIALALDRVWAVGLGSGRWLENALPGWDRLVADGIESWSRAVVGADGGRPLRRETGEDGEDGESHEGRMAGIGGGSGAGGEARDLVSALRELAAAVGGAGALRVALLPPLAGVREVFLPKLADEEVERLLARAPGRYVVGVRQKQAVAATRGASVGDGRFRYLVAAAPERVLDDVYRAAESAGWRVDGVVAAHWAWTCAIGRLGARRGVGGGERRVSWFPAVTDQGVEVVEMLGGQPAGVRRVPWWPGAPGRTAAAVGEVAGAAAGAPLVVFGPAAFANALAEEVPDSAREGIVGREPASGAWSRPTIPAGAAAAAGAASRGPRLAPESVRVREDREAWRRGRRRGFGAAACLLAAAAVELWGVQRRLGSVEAERHRIAPAVARAVAAEDSLSALEGRLAAIEAVEHEAPRWSGVVIELARRLPDDAYLLSLQAEGDSVALEGRAVHAADVVEALGRSALLHRVRVSAPVEREAGHSLAAPVERFMLDARLAPEHQRARP